MPAWLPHALDYIPQWLDYQLTLVEQPGCVIAVADRGEVVLERAFGHADLKAGTPLTPRHRFRVASHSKTFTAAAVMRLREMGKLSLDDAAGKHVSGLHPDVASATISQLLSHSAGIVRDGWDSGQWQHRRPFLNEAELRAELARPPMIDPNTRFKYSNHGFGLAGLVIEAVSGRPYNDFVAEEVVRAAGLSETHPDAPIDPSVPTAKGYSPKLPLGERVVMGFSVPTHALASATGFVSTAGDLARFFAQLDPGAEKSFLSVASRREMTRRQWKNPDTAFERHYGLGTMSGTIAGVDWVGHGGAFPGYITRTSTLPQHGITVSILTNAVDGWANQWHDGLMSILAGFEKHGAPSEAVADWGGRWWGIWGAFDLLPMGNVVKVASPGMLNPLFDASELTVSEADEAKVTLGQGYGNFGETVRRLRDGAGKVEAIRFGGSRWVSREELTREMRERYEA